MMNPEKLNLFNDMIRTALDLKVARKVAAHRGLTLADTMRADLEVIKAQKAYREAVNAFNATR